MTAPRSVSTPPGPTENVSLLGTVAKAAAGTDSVAVTSCGVPGLTVTLVGETVSNPDDDARLYVTGVAP